MATSRYGLPVGCRRGAEGLRRRQPVHATVYRQHVAEADRESPARLARHGASGVGEATDPSRAIVGVEIVTRQPWRSGAAVHQPTDDRAAIGVGVFDRRKHTQGRAAAWRLVAM